MTPTRTSLLLAPLLVLSAAALFYGCKTTAKTGASMKIDASTPLKPVKHVDLARYMGDWRVIANVPYFAEKGCIDSIEGYRLREDGRIDNFFTFRKGSFDAPQEQIKALAAVYNKETNAEWRVRFFGVVNAKYFITDLDPDYRWAVVAHPSRKYGWVLAREKTLPESTYNGILERLKEQGYDPAQFVKVPQLPDQLPTK